MNFSLQNNDVHVLPGLRNEWTPLAQKGLRISLESFPFFPPSGLYYRGPGDHPWPGGLFLGPSYGFK